MKHLTQIIVIDMLELQDIHQLDNLKIIIIHIEMILKV